MAYKDKKKKQEYDKKYYEDHKDEVNARAKTWNQAHKEDRKAYQKADVNSDGKTKNSIRTDSRKYLFNTLKFKKIDGYETHHCFGYENKKEFIYIPRCLHKSVIHPFLRKNKIDADTDHFELIKPLLDSCKEKIYIIKDGEITEYK